MKVDSLTYLTTAAEAAVVATRVTIGVPEGADPERWAPVFDALRA